VLRCRLSPLRGTDRCQVSVRIPRSAGGELRRDEESMKLKSGHANIQVEVLNARKRLLDCILYGHFTRGHARDSVA